MTFNSGLFQRVGGYSDEYYYYTAFQITVSTSGTYSFTTDSDLDTVGYLYDSSFDPSDPTANLITDDDDNGDIHLQFLVEAFLHAEHNYVLVVTTHGETQVGQFLVSATGPDFANVMSIIPVTSHPMTTRKFLTITFTS